MSRARLLLGVLGLVIVCGAAWWEPRDYGDGGEYFLMAESLWNHGSPDQRPEDLASLSRLHARYDVPIPYRTVQKAYTDDGSGRRYCYHFWGYPLATLPVKALLHALGGNEFKAPQLTNALLLALVMWLAAGTPSGASAALQWQRSAFAALLALGPPTWFVLWPHPEVFSCALVGLALWCLHERRFALAVLCAALASVQNPPLVLLAIVVALHGGLAAGRDWRRWLPLALALAPAAAPFVFYWSHFGVASLIAARHEAAAEHLSVGKALELLFDLNLGLLPYVPLTLGLFAVEVVRALRRFALPAQLAAVLLLMAWACTSTRNWNHGTSGPSRYGVWLLPLVVFVAAGLAGPAPGPRRRAAIAAALGVQVAILLARGGLLPRHDYHEHSALAQLVLDRWPALYAPSPEIFVERTLHVSGPPAGPVVYERDGRCRKAYARAGQREALEALCGPLPGRLPERGWGYLDW